MNSEEFDYNTLIEIVERYLDIHDIEDIISNYPEDQIPIEAKNSLRAYETKSYRLNWIFITTIIHDIIADKFMNDVSLEERKRIISYLLEFLIYLHEPVDIGDFPNYNFNFANVNRLIRETKVLDDDNPAKWTKERKDLCIDLYKEGLIYHAFVVYNNFYWAWYLYRIKPLGYELTDVDDGVIKVKHFIDTLLLFSDISVWYSNYLLLLYNPKIDDNTIRYNDDLFSFIVSMIHEDYVNLAILFFEEFKGFRIAKPINDEELFNIIIPKDDETGKYIAITNEEQREKYMINKLSEYNLIEYVKWFV